MIPLEIEIKYYIPKKEEIRAKIIDLCKDSHGLLFEKNIRYENSDKSLLKQNSIIRLRQTNKTNLTFKSKIPDKTKQFRIHKELEVEVSDFQTMNEILLSIGFHHEQIYEKWRETFSYNNAIICLDSMPFGCFLEIEGEKEAIIDTSNKLGLDWNKRILLSYIEIFFILKEKFNLPFSDITFSNFEKYPVDFSKIVDIFIVNQNKIKRV
ncbi:MAG: class IV adenylate cyclase [Desulfobacterales bacterium]|nr:class IV adenylate cyclase [Desulfobacterales bacterium]